MSRNSTLKFLDLFLKETCTSYKSPHHILSREELEPRKETVNKVLAYACSVKGVKMKSNDKILISLN